MSKRPTRDSRSYHWDLDPDLVIVQAISFRLFNLLEYEHGTTTCSAKRPGAAAQSSGTRRPTR